MLHTSARRGSAWHCNLTLVLLVLQYNIVMHTCEDTASVKLVLRQMEEAGIPYDPATFMTCFKVFCRSGEYDKAVRAKCSHMCARGLNRLFSLQQVKVLAAAEQEGILDAGRVKQTISNALRQMSKRNQTGSRRSLQQAVERIFG